MQFRKMNSFPFCHPLKPLFSFSLPASTCSLLYMTEKKSNIKVQKLHILMLIGHFLFFVLGNHTCVLDSNILCHLMVGYYSRTTVHEIDKMTLT